MAYQAGISIFATMSQMCREHQAINLSQGCPDFDCDPELVELVNAAMCNGHNQYSSMEGILPLREALAHKFDRLYKRSYNPATEITITAGATEAIYSALVSMVNKDDEVIIFEPAFDSYVPVIRMAGGVPVPIALQYPDYSIDWNTVAKLITSRTKLILINSPHNPTGSVLTENDLVRLAEVTRNTHIKIISDEVYEHIIFEHNPHQSLALHEELASKSFIIGSFGKTFHTTGWRMGFAIAPAELMTSFRKVHQYVTFSAATPPQYAIAEYLKQEDKYLELPSFYQKKRDTFLNLMTYSRFSFIPSKGTYFQLMSYDNISDLLDLDFSFWLVKHLKVASIPLSPFFSSNYHEKVIRFCFAKKTETLEKAAEILCKI